MRLRRITNGGVLVVVERCRLYCYTQKIINFGSVNIKKKPEEKALEFLKIVSFCPWKANV